MQTREAKAEAVREAQRRELEAREAQTRDVNIAMRAQEEERMAMRAVGVSRRFLSMCPLLWTPPEMLAN